MNITEEGKTMSIEEWANKKSKEIKRYKYMSWKELEPQFVDAVNKHKSFLGIALRYIANLEPTFIIYDKADLRQQFYRYQAIIRNREANPKPGIPESNIIALASGNTIEETINKLIKSCDDKLIKEEN